jgi:hypothetical protein
MRPIPFSICNHHREIHRDGNGMTPTKIKIMHTPIPKIIIVGTQK